MARTRAHPLPHSYDVGVEPAAPKIKFCGITDPADAEAAANPTAAPEGGPAPSSYSSTQSTEATGTLASDDQLAALWEKLAGGGQS